MTARPATAGTGAPPWTCPFCPLLCDGFGVDADQAGGLSLAGSTCPRATAALATFGTTTAAARPHIGGVACDLDTAIAAAAALLRHSQQALFAGLGTDVAGARALYALAQDTGAICDAHNGAALMQGLRVLQDRGAYTTTLAEVRTRADVIVCVGGSPLDRQPEFFRRCGLGEDLVAARHVVMLGGGASDLQALQGLPGVTSEMIALQGDVFDTVALLAQAVAGHPAPPPLQALAQRLQAATYAVLVWETARLPAQGALLVEALNRIVGTLNRSTRAATLPLGGGDGAATSNQVHTWLSGLPLRTRHGAAGLEHEPHCFDARHLLDDRAVDALLWVQSFSTAPLPAPLHLPHIVLGHPALAAQARAPGSVFIPVSTPGIGSAGHLFRTDGGVLLPLRAVRDDGLPTVAAVVQQLRGALRA